MDIEEIDESELLHSEVEETSEVIQDSDNLPIIDNIADWLRNPWQTENDG